MASAAHGVVTRAQLRRHALTDAEIRERLEKGSLLREHRCVYRVGHRAPSVEATYMAAVLACGDGALLMGAAAAHLYALIRSDAPGPGGTTRTERRIDGIETHRPRRDERGTEWRGVQI